MLLLFWSCIFDLNMHSVVPQDKLSPIFQRGEADAPDSSGFPTDDADRVFHKH
jgi:hypothetical protein